MPDVIKKSVNNHIAQSDSHRCEVVETPRQFQPYTGPEVLQSPELTKPDGYGEPEWLEAYLAERMLAGIALVGSAENAE